MNMNRWNQGNQFENPADKSPEQDFGGMSLDEISRQLYVQKTKYEEVANGLRAGDFSSIDYAENLKKVLAGFSSILHKESRATAEGKRLSDIIEERIHTLNELTKTTRTSH